MKTGIVIFVFLFGSIAAHLRDNAKKIYIGAALVDAHIKEDANYKQIAAEEFNSFTPEYQMKWKTIEPVKGEINYVPGDTLVSFGQTNDMKIRGHTLVWHIEVPEWVEGLTGDDLAKALKDHIINEVTHYKGKLYAWDVVNEVVEEDGSLRDTIWSQNFGKDYIADAFKVAREVDPSAKLYINDYNIETINAKSDGLYNLVSELLEAGVPIDGVGFQCHLTTGQIPADLPDVLQRFADLDLDVALTEIDIKSTGDDEDQQAEDYATLIKYCLAVDRCVGVTMWGVTDQYSWIPDQFPLPWDSSYRAKPAVAAMEAVLE